MIKNDYRKDIGYLRITLAKNEVERFCMKLRTLFDTVKRRTLSKWKTINYFQNITLASVKACEQVSLLRKRLKERKAKCDNLRVINKRLVAKYRLLSKKRKYCPRETKKFADLKERQKRQRIKDRNTIIKNSFF